MINKLIALNNEWCNKLERYLPQARVNIFHQYDETVARYMNSRTDQTIVDVGGGKTCSFAIHRKPDMNTKIIAVDMSQEEMENNLGVDEKKVAIIDQHLPFKDNEVDMVVSRSVLEHLKNLECFIVEANRILKKDGYFIHLFPSKFASFAIINQLLPKRLSKKIVTYFHPDTKGICGFPAYYNKCFYSSIKTLLKENGYEIANIYLSYYQASYFKFFIPLFLIMAFYEGFLQFFRAKNLCAYIMVVAKKSTGTKL